MGGCGALQETVEKFCYLLSIIIFQQIQSNMSMHHYRCTALWFINIRQKGRFWAAFLASGSPTPNEDKMLQTFWIWVERGLTGGLLQLSGSCANRIWLATANSFIRVTCPNTESWRDLTTEESVGCWLIRRTAPFLKKSCQRVSKILLRHHWSNATIRCTSAFLTIQHSDPYNTQQQPFYGPLSGTTRVSRY